MKTDKEVRYLSTPELVEACNNLMKQYYGLGIGETDVQAEFK